MSHQKHLVSLGMAVYNGEKCIEETLDSILSQTFGDFELIISDNASTDRTQEICQAYAAKDSRVRYFRNPKNLGIAPNYNRVFNLSSGQYCKLADYDDVLTPEFLSICVDILDRHPEVVVCYPKVEIIDESSNVIGVYDPGPNTSSPKSYDRFHNLILKPELAIQSMGLIRRAAIEKTSLYGSYPSSDEVFLAELALLGAYYEIPERILKVRLHPKQTTRGEYSVQRSRITLFDTSLEGKIVLPKWLYVRGCLRAINNAPLNTQEKLRCYGVMARWLLVPAHIRAMGKDVLLAVKQLASRSLSKPKINPPQTI